MHITQIMHNVWTQITPTPLFGVTLTVLSYAIGLAIQRAMEGQSKRIITYVGILGTNLDCTAGIQHDNASSYQRLQRFHY
jgi:hypothetical protein